MKRLHTFMLLVLCVISVCAQDSDAKPIHLKWDTTGLDSIIDNSMWFLVPILVLSCVMEFQRRKRNKEGHLESFQHMINLISFDISCVLLWGYIFMAKENSLWFFYPGSVGVLSVFGFLFLGFVAWTQTKTFQNVFDDIQYNHNVKFNLYLGFLSTLGATPLHFLLESLWGDVASLLTIMAFLLCQLIQIGIIFIRVFKSAGSLCAVMAVFTYIVGYITVLVQLLVLVSILIGLFILKLAWMAFCAMAKRDENEEQALRDAEWYDLEQRRREERGY